MMFAAGMLAGAAGASAVGWWLLRRRGKMLGKFFGFAAHEINTPITAINMTILNLLGGVFGDPPKEQLPWLEIMREQVTRLNAMVGELRDLIHLELNRDLVMRAEPIDAKEALETAVRAIRHGCEHAGVEVALTMPKALPALRGDPDRLPRCLASLLFHARKFRLSGGLAVSARAEPGAVAFEIVYHGPKMSAEEACRSLAVFYPAHRRHEHTANATGLGLGVPRIIMERQGGALSIVVEPDGRTTLTMRAKC